MRAAHWSNFVVCQVFIGVKFARDFYKKIPPPIWPWMAVIINKGIRKKAIPININILVRRCVKKM